ncbi:hypothetical protein CEUSTIGMA_g1079.t1 [Chlamydomonas eustigma]|uniref:3-deoxy-D-manno-octulosonic-acid transferase N-terminal domain-containing protein n=1 Tax=Chlamydomonas eustigma TaxID=1157962 RepID=A0A250WS13_9CHLO|nr:hypothetical protein CEUSTIGMA_g1079.t1 [Chlamydomonas eustigma]|eukprot:GAX73628.1 hypothetical protein CEUSTIGMA_g1079.t1 [Chlamydomonas eustigma]
MDTPVCVALFMKKWRPQVGVVMGSPLHPHLLLVAAQYGVKMALLNGQLSGDDVLAWHSRRVQRAVLSDIMSKFDLIVPSSDLDFGHFCLFGAEMRQMPGWCGDLRHASALGAGVWHLSRPQPQHVKQLRSALGRRPTWVAAHTQPGEERVITQVHCRIAASQHLHELRTILVPAEGGRCLGLRHYLETQGLSVDLWTGPAGEYGGDFLLVEDLSLLPLLYTACETVLVANNSLLGAKGWDSGSVNSGCDLMAGPAVAGCAVLVGAHGGSVSAMAEDLNGAAVAAAEEAAAAVRNAGSVMDENTLAQAPANSETLQQPSGAGRQQQQLFTRTLDRPDAVATRRPDRPVPPGSQLRLTHLHEAGPISASAPVSPSGGESRLPFPGSYNELCSPTVMGQSRQQQQQAPQSAPRAAHRLSRMNDYRHLSQSHHSLSISDHNGGDLVLPSLPTQSTVTSSHTHDSSPSVPPFGASSSDSKHRMKEASDQLTRTHPSGRPSRLDFVEYPGYFLMLEQVAKQEHSDHSSGPSTGEMGPYAVDNAGLDVSRRQQRKPLSLSCNSTPARSLSSSSSSDGGLSSSSSSQHSAVTELHVSDFWSPSRRTSVTSSSLMVQSSLNAVPLVVSGSHPQIISKSKDIACACDQESNIMTECSMASGFQAANGTAVPSAAATGPRCVRRELVMTSPGELVMTSPGELVMTSPGELVMTSPGELVMTSPGELVMTSPGELVMTSPGELVMTSPGELVMTSPGELVMTSPGQNGVESAPSTSSSGTDLDPSLRSLLEMLPDQDPNSVSSERFDSHDSENVFTPPLSSQAGHGAETLPGQEGSLQGLEHNPTHSQGGDVPCGTKSSLDSSLCGASHVSAGSETVQVSGDLSMLSNNGSSSRVPSNVSSVSLHGSTPLGTAVQQVSSGGSAVVAADELEVVAEHHVREPSQKRLHRQSLACWLDSSPPASIPGSPPSVPLDLQHLQQIVQGKISHCSPTPGASRKNSISLSRLSSAALSLPPSSQEAREAGLTLASADKPEHSVLVSTTTGCVREALGTDIKGCQDDVSLGGCLEGRADIFACDVSQTVMVGVSCDGLVQDQQDSHRRHATADELDTTLDDLSHDSKDRPGAYHLQCGEEEHLASAFEDPELLQGRLQAAPRTMLKQAALGAATAAVSGSTIPASAWMNQEGVCPAALDADDSWSSQPDEAPSHPSAAFFSSLSGIPGGTGGKLPALNDSEFSLSYLVAPSMYKLLGSDSISSASSAATRPGSSGRSNADAVGAIGVPAPRTRASKPPLGLTQPSRPRSYLFMPLNSSGDLLSEVEDSSDESSLTARPDTGSRQKSSGMVISNDYRLEGPLASSLQQSTTVAPVQSGGMGPGPAICPISDSSIMTLTRSSSDSKGEELGSSRDGSADDDLKANCEALSLPAGSSRRGSESEVMRPHSFSYWDLACSDLRLPAGSATGRRLNLPSPVPSESTPQQIVGSFHVARVSWTSSIASPLLPLCGNQGMQLEAAGDVAGICHSSADLEVLRDCEGSAPLISSPKSQIGVSKMMQCDDNGSLLSSEMQQITAGWEKTKSLHNEAEEEFGFSPSPVMQSRVLLRTVSSSAGFLGRSLSTMKDARQAADLRHATMPQATLLSLLEEAKDEPSTPRSSQGMGAFETAMHDLDGLIEEAMPETPTSRMSCSSPFAAGAVYDRPSPFRLSRTGSQLKVTGSSTSSMAASPVPSYLSTSPVPPHRNPNPGTGHVSQPGLSQDTQTQLHQATLPAYSFYTASAKLTNKRTSRLSAPSGNSSIVSRASHTSRPSSDSEGGASLHRTHQRTRAAHVDAEEGTHQRTRAAHVDAEEGTHQRTWAAHVDAEEGIPETPTSMMSSHSPFAGGVVDRPSPFKVTNTSNMLPSVALKSSVDNHTQQDPNSTHSTPRKHVRNVRSQAALSARNTAAPSASEQMSSMQEWRLRGHREWTALLASSSDAATSSGREGGPDMYAEPPSPRAEDYSATGSSIPPRSPRSPRCSTAEEVHLSLRPLRAPQSPLHPNSNHNAAAGVAAGAQSTPSRHPPRPLSSTPAAAAPGSMPPISVQDPSSTPRRGTRRNRSHTGFASRFAPSRLQAMAMSSSNNSEDDDAVPRLSYQAVRPQGTDSREAAPMSPRSLFRTVSAPSTAMVQYLRSLTAEEQAQLQSPGLPYPLSSDCCQSGSTEVELKQSTGCVAPPEDASAFEKDVSNIVTGTVAFGRLPSTPRKPRPSSPERTPQIPADQQVPPSSPKKPSVPSRTSSFLYEDMAMMMANGLETSRSRLITENSCLLRTGSRKLSGMSMSPTAEALGGVGSRYELWRKNSLSESQKELVGGSSPTASSPLSHLSKAAATPLQYRGSPFADFAAASAAAATVIISSPQSAGKSQAELVSEVVAAAAAGMEAAGLTAVATASQSMDWLSPRPTTAALLLAQNESCTGSQYRPSPCRKLFMDNNDPEPQNQNSSSASPGSAMHLPHPHPSTGTPGTSLQIQIPTSSTTTPLSTAQSSGFPHQCLSAAGSIKSPYRRLNFHDDTLDADSGAAAAAAAARQLTWGAGTAGSSSSSFLTIKTPQPMSPGMTGSPGGNGLEGLEHLITKTLKVPASPLAAADSKGRLHRTSDVSAHAQSNTAVYPAAAAAAVSAPLMAAMPENPRSALFQELQEIKEQLMGVESLLIKQRTGLTETSVHKPDTQPTSVSSPLSAPNPPITACTAPLSSSSAAAPDSVAIELAALKQQMAVMMEMMTQQSIQMKELHQVLVSQQNKSQAKTAKATSGHGPGPAVEDDSAVTDALTAGTTPPSQPVLDEGMLLGRSKRHLHRHRGGQRHSAAAGSSNAAAVPASLVGVPEVPTAAGHHYFPDRQHGRTLTTTHRVSYDTSGDQNLLAGPASSVAPAAAAAAAVNPAAHLLSTRLLEPDDDASSIATDEWASTSGTPPRQRLLASLHRSMDGSPTSVSSYASRSMLFDADMEPAPSAPHASHVQGSLPSEATAQLHGHVAEQLQSDGMEIQEDDLTSVAVKKPSTDMGHLQVPPVYLTDNSEQDPNAASAASDMTAEASPFPRRHGRALASKMSRLAVARSAADPQLPHQSVPDPHEELLHQYSSEAPPGVTRGIPSFTQHVRSASSGVGGSAMDSPSPSSRLHQRGYFLPASQLARGATGPAVWRVDGVDELAAALTTLLRDPLERRSRGHAAAQAAAKMATSLVSTVWCVLDEQVVTPALQAYVAEQQVQQVGSTRQ